MEVVPPSVQGAGTQARGAVSKSDIFGADPGETPSKVWRAQHVGGIKAWLLAGCRYAGLCSLICTHVVSPHDFSPGWIQSR